MENFVTTRDVCARLRVCRETVLGYIKGGKLDAVKVGNRWLIREDSLQRLIRREERDDKHNVGNHTGRIAEGSALASVEAGTRRRKG